MIIKSTFPWHCAYLFWLLRSYLISTTVTLNIWEQIMSVNVWLPIMLTIKITFSNIDLNFKHLYLLGCCTTWCKFIWLFQNLVCLQNYRTLQGLEIPIFKFHNFSRFFQTVRTPYFSVFLRSAEMLPVFARHGLKVCMNLRWREEERWLGTKTLWLAGLRGLWGMSDSTVGGHCRSARGRVLKVHIYLLFLCHKHELWQRKSLFKLLVFVYSAWLWGCVGLCA